MSQPYLTGLPRILSLFALSLATFLIVLDYSIANVSIPYISGDLAVSYDQGTYVITAFAVGNAIVLPISGWLTQRIGSVRLLIISVLLFVFFSWFCGFAFNFQMLVVGRFLQGFVSGPLVPLSQSLIVSTNPPEKKNAVLAVWSVIVIAAPVIGPILGGWISFDYKWPWIFYINIPFGLISAGLVWILLRRFESPIVKKPVDLIGFCLLAIAVTCLQIVLDKGEQFDWFKSNLIITLSVISVLGFAYLITWELLHPTPLIELSLLKIKSYTVSIIFISFMYAMYFGSVVLIPLWLQSNMGYDAIWAGIAVAPIGIAPFILSTLSGWMISKFGKLKPLFVCFFLFSLSCFYTAFFDTSVDLYHIWMSRFLLGLGLAFFITPLFALSIQDVALEKLPSATGIFHFVRAMFGGVGTSVFTTMWIRRSAYHHEREGSAVTAFSQNTKDLFATMHELGIKGKKALAVTNDILNDQAAVLALNDCFYLMGWLFLILILFLPLGKKLKKHPS
jgi:MFS transporter, DHA2 family, multidrug resistance protein